MSRLLQTLKRCWLVFAARTFGNYRHSVGSPNDEDYDVYTYRGLTVCIPNVRHQGDRAMLQQGETNGRD